MYERKILLIKERDKTYTAKKRTLGGAVALLCNGKTTKISVSLTNVDNMRSGDWTVFIDCDGKSFAYPLCAMKELPFASINDVGVVFTAGSKAVAYADTSGEFNTDLLRRYSGGETRTETETTVKNSKRVRAKQKIGINADTAEGDKSGATSYGGVRAKTEIRRETNRSTDYDKTAEPRFIRNFAETFAWKAAERAAKEIGKKLEEEVKIENMTEYEKFIISSDNYYISDENPNEILKTEKSADRSGEKTHENKEKARTKESDVNAAQTREKPIGGKAERETEKDVSTESKSGGEKDSDIKPRAEMSAKKAVEKYAEVFGESAGKSGFYSAVKNELSTLFYTFPVCLELTENIKNSIWTRITGKEGDYFALGLLLCGGEPKYICYALPMRRGMFSGKSVFLDIGEGYRVVSQDTETGRIAEGVEFGL